MHVRMLQKERPSITSKLALRTKRAICINIWNLRIGHSLDSLRARIEHFVLQMAGLKSSAILKELRTPGKNGIRT